MSPRITFISGTGNRSGAEAVLGNLMTAAHDRGAEVTCLTPAGPLASSLPARYEWVPIPAQGRNGARSPGSLVELTRATRLAATAIRTHSQRSQAVVVNDLASLPAVRLAGGPAPVTWLVHDVLRKPEWFTVLRLTRSALDNVVAVSHAAARPLRQRGLAVEVVPNGVQWPVAARPADEQHPAVLGCAAALTPWKGHAVLLDALALMKRTDSRLELAGTPFPGDGQYAESLRQRASAPDIHGRVTFLGRVDPLPTMRTWTIAVSPSVEPEAMPLAVLEAMSVGLPVVATAHGGSLEILGDAGGYLVPPNEPAALARALDALLDDGDDRARLAAAGRRLVSQHYRQDAQIAALLDRVKGVEW